MGGNGGCLNGAYGVIAVCWCVWVGFGVRGVCAICTTCCNLYITCIQPKQPKQPLSLFDVHKRMYGGKVRVRGKSVRGKLG